MSSRRRSLNDHGQTTLEYIFILVAAAFFVILVGRTFIIPVMTKLTQGLGQVMDQAFQPQNLHKFPIKPSN